MTSIAIYLSFLGAWVQYRKSRYWPLAKRSLIQLRYVNYWSWAVWLISVVLLCFVNGITTGLLFFLGILMLVFSLLIIIVNSPTALRLTVFVFFHVFCILSLFLSL